METSIKFYQEGLGFPKMESSPEVAFFTLNGSWLGLYSRESLAEDATVSPEGSGFKGTPIIDIKPYQPCSDRVKNVQLPDCCSDWPQCYEGSATFDWTTVFNF